MQVEKVSECEYRLLFDKDEVIFLHNEAIENITTENKMFETILGILFIAGYKTLIGKD